MRRVLGLPPFRRLLVSTIFNEFTYSIGVVALSLLVYRRTGSAIGSMAFFLCSQFAPALVGPWLVSLLDQRSLRYVLGILYVLEAVAFLGLAALVHHFSLAAVLVLVVVDGLLNLTARVLGRAAWTDLTSGKGLMREAQAVNNLFFSVGFMAGPAVGGVIIALGGTVEALLVDSGLFALLCLVLVTARGLPSTAHEQKSPDRRLRAGLRVVRSEPTLRRLLLLWAAAMLFFMSSTPVEVVLAEHSMHAGASGYGALLSAWGAGAVVGSAIYARWRRLPSRTLIVLGTFALGVGLAVMAAAPSIVVACVGSAVAGVGNGMVFVAVRTAVQEATPERWTSLTVSINESLNQAVPGAAFVLGGGMAALAGPRPALAVGGAGSLAVAILIRLWLPAYEESITRVPESGHSSPSRQVTLASPEADRI